MATKAVKKRTRMTAPQVSKHQHDRTVARLTSLLVETIKDISIIRQDLRNLHTKVDVFGDWFNRFQEMAHTVERLQRREVARLRELGAEPGVTT